MAIHIILGPAPHPPAMAQLSPFWPLLLVPAIPVLSSPQSFTGTAAQSSESSLRPAKLPMFSWSGSLHYPCQEIFFTRAITAINKVGLVLALLNNDSSDQSCSHLQKENTIIVKLQIHKCWCKLCRLCLTEVSNHSIINLTAISWYTDTEPPRLQYLGQCNNLLKKFHQLKLFNIRVLVTGLTKWESASNSFQ